MGTEFILRLLDCKRYDALVLQLQAIARGDEDRLRELVATCRARLATPEVVRWNEGNDIVLEWWQEKLEDLDEANSTSAAELGNIAVSIFCMPEFQRARRPDEESPNFEVLAHGDGGLFGLITEDEWCDQFFMHAEPAEYGPGLSMFVLSADELRRFQAAFENVDIARCTSRYGLAARDKILDMIRRCNEGPAYTLAISMEG